MREFWAENIKIQIQQLMPVISSILFVLIFCIPRYPFVADNIRPYVSIICVYFWLIYRPYMFGIISIYIIGMLEDIVSSTPFGINIFTILFVYVLTNLIYKFVANKPFTVTWYGFAFIAASASIIKWFVLSIYYSQFLPFIPLIFSLLATIVFYPIFSFVNAYIQNHLMEDDI